MNRLSCKICEYFYLVKNYTDIDDKIIKKASDELKENGEDISYDKLKEKVNGVAVHYLEVYRDQFVQNQL